MAHYSSAARADSGLAGRRHHYLPAAMACAEQKASQEAQVADYGGQLATAEGRGGG
jgi:hypothetical protein